MYGAYSHLCLTRSLQAPEMYAAVPNMLPAPYTGCLLLGLPTWSWERYVPLLVFEFGVLAGLSSL